MTRRILYGPGTHAGLRRSIGEASGLLRGPLSIRRSVIRGATESVSSVVPEDEQDAQTERMAAPPVYDGSEDS